MVHFTTTIQKFNEQSEKTGWTYILVREDIAQQMMPGSKKGFRVKGSLDQYVFEKMSLLPFGGGDFILPLKATIRKAIGKGRGATVNVKMEVDNNPIKPPAEFVECLADEPNALDYFNQLPMSHRNYFINYIQSAKTDATKAKRIALAVNALSRKWGFGEMMRSLKADKDGLMKM